MSGLYPVVHSGVGPERVGTDPSGGYRIGVTETGPVRGDADTQVAAPVKLFDGLTDRHCVGIVARRSLLGFVFGAFGVLVPLSVDVDAVVDCCAVMRAHIPGVGPVMRIDSPEGSEAG